MLEGAMEPKTIAERAAKLGFPAVALTDRNGLYGAMPFGDACITKGVQPIIGAMLGLARPPEIGGEAHLDRPLEQEPHVPFSKLDGLSEGLIALTAGGEGALARLLADGQADKAEA